MPTPTSRVLAVLELLQTHSRISGAQIASRLGIDGRALRRYIVALEDMGIPITAERGRHGGYGLMPGFKLPPMMFTNDEATALSLGLLAARRLGLGDAAPAVVGAQAKLERIMPAALTQRVRALSETVQLDLGGPAAAANDHALAVLSFAARDRQTVALSYADSAAGVTARDVDPYGLVYRTGCWYAVGLCHLRGALRSFRLDRIRSAEARAVRFERPPDFDALAYLSLSLATLPRAHAIEVLLKTDIATARRHLVAGIGVFEICGDGVVIRNQSEDLDWFARQLAGVPFAFIIRTPDALRGVLKQCADRLLLAASQECDVP